MKTLQGRDSGFSGLAGLIIEVYQEFCSCVLNICSSLVRTCIEKRIKEKLKSAVGLSSELNRKA